MPKSRRLPGVPIEWKAFFGMNLVGRDLRIFRRESGGREWVIRGRLRSIKPHDGTLFVDSEGSAIMNLQGRRTGVWVRYTDRENFLVPIGNRPRQLEGGRILLLQQKNWIVDILGPGDLLAREEIRRK